MGYAAAVISLEEFRQARAQAEARRQLHERFDRWLDALEGRVQKERPTLEQLTQEIFATRQELTGMITKALVEQAYSETLILLDHVDAGVAEKGSGALPGRSREQEVFFARLGLSVVGDQF